MSTTRTRAVRRIAADPASTALLLAAPTALELWPGVRPVGRAGDRVLVDAVLPTRPQVTAATVSAHPPQRTPTAFLTRFAWHGPDLPRTRGSLRVSAALRAAGEVGPGTTAELLLESEDVESSGLDAAALAGMAEAFLDNLAAAAEHRNQAA